MEFKGIKITEKMKKIIIIASALSLGVFLIILSAIPSDSGKKQEKSRLDSYIEETEKRLCETVSGISGAGNTKVFITTENTFETVYASNASVDESASGKTTEKSLAYASGSSYTQEPVVVKELTPDIKGVLIVCEGGRNQSVKEEIISSVSTALGISQNKIYVTGGTD